MRRVQGQTPGKPLQRAVSCLGAAAALTAGPEPAWRAVPLARRLYFGRIVMAAQNHTQERMHANLLRQ